MMFWVILEVGPLRSAVKILSKKKKKKILTSWYIYNITKHSGHDAALTC